MKRCGVSLIFMCLFAVPLTNAAELTVFAAASLMDALKEIGARWEQAGGESVVFNFASSSTLEQQISAGAPADLFLSADEAKMDQLAKQDLILPGTRESILSNTLVIVVRKESRLSLTKAADIANVAALALAEPQTVPAGIYAREYLEKIGAWNAVKSKVIPTENVRAALAAVEAGNADAGIVYKTDAAISKELKIAWEVPASEGPKISYAAAILRATGQPELARKFLAWLTSPEAKQSFHKYGFLPPAPHD